MRYKVGDTVKKVSIEILNKSVSDIIHKVTPVKGAMELGKKTFIDKLSNISRTSFKKDYPTNKIVYDPSEADIYLIPSARNFRYACLDLYSLFREGGRRNWRGVMHEEAVVKNSFMAAQINAQVDRLHVLSSDKPIYYDSCIKVGTAYNRIMSLEEKDKIIDLLKASDPEMNQLGLTLLTSFNIEGNEDNYALCFLHMKNIYVLRKTRVLKTIRKEIFSKYQNLRI